MSSTLSYQQKCDLYVELAAFVTDERKQRFDEVARHRTRYLTVILEDIYQPHNASAVLRSCDCFGVQDVHIIENKNQYRVNPDVALGASKWLSLFNYNTKSFNSTECIHSLKKNGYQIIAASPHKNDCLIHELDLTHKIALLFGTEMKGISEEALREVDGFAKIPMTGFTESFNISVSAAIALYALTEKLRKSDIEWHLSNEELIDMKIGWVKNSLRDGNTIEKTCIEKIRNKKSNTT